MEAKELRLGNYTNFGIVTEIHESAFYVKDSKGESFKNKWADIQPVRITPERLLNCGFENWGNKPGDTEWAIETEYVLHNAVDGTSDFKVVRTKYSFTNGETSIHWGIRIDQDDIYVRHLDYIHQLQNVFHSLIGYDLTPEFSPAKP